MRLFSISEAGHYTSLYKGSVGDSERSITEFHTERILRKQVRMLSEGTPIFDEYRDCLLRSVERALFFSASHYRRALDLMTSSASPWAHVTLYYGNWHAAHALLGLFGCAIFSKHVIDVQRGLPGRQELRVRSIGTGLGDVYTRHSRGSHQKFWDLFYQAFRATRAVFPSSFQPALTPIGSNPLWQIEMRNAINYDLFHSGRLAKDFDLGFAYAGFPNCLPGPMKTQYKVFEQLLEMSFHYARDFQIATDALDGLRGHSPLRTKVRQLIYNTRPSGLVRKTKKSKLT